VAPPGVIWIFSIGVVQKSRILNNFPIKIFNSAFFAASRKKPGFSGFRSRSILCAKRKERFAPRQSLAPHGQTAKLWMRSIHSFATNQAFRRFFVCWRPWDFWRVDKFIAL
jgi:hypothetical protein